VLTSVSQPESEEGPQWAKPGLQANTHLLSAHLDGSAVLVAPQTFPHAPQLVTSVAVLASQPLRGSLSQSPKPLSHVNEHAPALHAAAAFVVAGHGEHDSAAHPTLGSSFDTHEPLQDFCVALQPPGPPPSGPAPPPTVKSPSSEVQATDETATITDEMSHERRMGGLSWG